MDPTIDPFGPRADVTRKLNPLASQTAELQLFESLVHQLIEKGVLTKNDALSVVQTVAEVKREDLEGGWQPHAVVRNELAALERIYASFQLVSDGPNALQVSESANVFLLRPPIHGDHPWFPRGI